MVSSPPRRHLDVPRIELRSLLCHKSGRRASSVPYTFHKLADIIAVSVFVVRTNVTPCSYTSVAQSANRFATTSAKSLHFARSSLVLGNYLYRPLVIKRRILPREEIEITILSRQIAILILAELILYSLCYLSLIPHDKRDSPLFRVKLQLKIV